jgi:hypothetical protein
MRLIEQTLQRSFRGSQSRDEVLNARQTAVVGDLFNRAANDIEHTVLRKNG